jgi:hypothetical protein
MKVASKCPIFATCGHVWALTNLICFEKKLRGAPRGALSSPKDFVFKGDEIFPQSFLCFSRSLYGVREEHTR